MQNNFSKCREWVPRGTRTIWRYLGALFLLFTFAIGNVWGAAHTITPNISGTQYEIYNIYSNSSAYAFFSSKTAILSDYQSWVSGELSNKGDGGATALEGWLATSSGKPGYGKGQVNDSKSVTMTVTNCIEVAFYSKSGGSRTSNLSVKYNNAEVGEVATNGNTYAAVVYGTALDPAKTYTITLYGSASNNCEVDQIRFKAPAGSMCTASLGGTTSNASATIGVSAGTITCSVNNGTAASATSYQWYKTASDKAAASSISGATTSSYSPNEASAGTYYYYCKVATTQITTAGAAGSVETALSGAFTFAAASTYTVTYQAGEGTGSDFVDNNATTVTGCPNTFTAPDGKSFAGWKNASTSADVAVGATVTADMTLVAQWEDLYSITPGSHDHGNIAADPTSAVAGATITLTATPESGYKLSAWDVYKTTDPATKVSVTNNQFTMPAYGVTISAEFIEATVLYDYSVMANKSFTDETVSADANNKDHTFGSEGNPQLIISKAGWDKKDNIINSFIKFFGGTSSMSVVIPTGRKATVTIKYGSYSTGKYLLVNGTEQTHPKKALDNSITTSNIDTYMPTVELTNQTGTLTLTANASGNNIYIAYVDVALTGYASYGITYHLNDGAWDGDAGAATYTYGTGIASLASNVTKNGCDFAGWYGNEGLTGDEITSIANNVTGDKELWAKWAPKSYTLTWDWNGGTCSATEGDDYTAHGLVAYGTTLVYPEASTVTKAGTAFAGWSSSPATMPAGDLTITAQWAPSHDITYKETKGASNSNPATYVEGVGVASFEPLEDVPNFHFNGWSPASIGTDATEDVDVTAQWVDAFNVTFSAGEGSGTVPATFQKWATATFNLPGQGDLVAPAGKVFAGWKANGAGETRAVGYEYTMTAAAVEFVAQWKAVTLLINYDGENYSLNTDKFTIYAGTELQNEEYTVDGKTFAKNFKFGGNCSSTPFAGQAWSNKFMAYDVASNSTDIKLYVYNKNSGNKKLYYQIVPEGSAAAAFQSVTITSKATNQVVSIPTITAAKGARVLFGIESTDVRICQIEVTEDGTALPAFGTNGYEFSVPGRAATASKAGAFDGFEFKTNADLKFISGQDYIALRNIDGSQYVKFTVATNIQLQVTTPNANKFYVSKTAAGDAEKDTKYGGSAAAHNVNLHAGTYYIAPAAGSSDGEVRITKLAFATAPAVKIVTFNVNGGSSVEAQEVFAGEKAVTPTAPTREGYRFVEWQLSGSTYDFDDAVAANITLDAVWQKIWTVTFDSDGGSDVAAATVDNGQAVAQPANPTRAGFDFVEWQLNSVVYDFATPVTANITLVATWEVAQDDATLSALSYNGNAIDVNSAVEVAGVKTYTVHLPWGSTIDPALVSITKNAESASLSAITYDGENKKATFSVESGNHLVVVNYAIQFVIDAKVGTSIVKAVISGGDQKAGFDATGIYGDKGYAYTRSNKKMDTADKFVGVKLLAGKTFEASDKLFVVTSTPADQGYIEIYEEAEGTNLIKATGVRDASEGIVVPELEGYSEFYIVRKASTGDQAWNGFVDYVEVTREMAPAIKSFKFGDDAATINEGAKTITIEMPYSTDVTALTPTVEAYGNNGATYTPAGATDFTSPVVYTVTDAYNEFHTDYTVTVNIAAPSTNAYLASLSVAGYALDFDKEEETYNIVLDYGTTVLPTITYEVEDAGLAEAVKVEDGVNGATTITVTPQAGESYKKVYTINFSVSTTPKFVIYDGQKSAPMAAIATSGSDVPTGFAWTITGASNTDASNGELSFEGKTYSKYVNLFTSATKAPDAGNTRYITITIPDGYVAKFRLVGCGNGNGTRSSFISKEITGTLDQSIAYATTTANNVLDGRTSDFQLPGTYYYCADNSIRLYELSVTLYPIDKERTMTQGRFGTICYPNGGRLLGAMLLEIAYFDPDQKKIFFDEVIGGQMVAGAPYLFLPNEGVDKFAIVYTDNVNAPAGHHNGLYGSYTQEALPTDGNHYIMLNNQYCKVVEANTYVGANRAYILLDKIGNDFVAPSYGRRRVSMDVQGEQVATGMEGLNVGDQPIKLMINGQMYILRGDKMYDATGRLVK